MVFNATFNNILVISWMSVLLVEETGVPRENHGVLLFVPIYIVIGDPITNSGKVGITISGLTL
jgi:hypothetical protein